MSWVVLFYPLATAGYPGLELAGAGCHRKVSDERIDRLAAPVGNIHTPAGILCDIDGYERLGHGPDLVELDEHGVRCLLFNTPLHEFGRRDEDIIADELDLRPEILRQDLPSRPVIFGEPVLNGDDRVGVDEFR